MALLEVLPRWTDKCFIQVILFADIQLSLKVIGGLDYWNGLLEWTTGMDFDLFFFFFPPELTIYIEELV